jgi:hypothetical protein
MHQRSICTIFACLLLLGRAQADDTMVTLGVGGLVPQKSTKVAMESEDLQISLHQITVRYVFQNTTGRDVEAMVAFPLPDLDGGTVYNEPVALPNETQLNFVNFSVTEDGKPVAARVESRAFLAGRDVTARLSAAGLPVSVLLEPLNDALMKISPTQREQLEREQLIMPDDFNPPLRATGRHGWWAMWTMRVRFYWIQRFPAHRTVTLTQTYQPVVGGSYIAADDDGSLTVRPYCGGAEVLREIEQIKRRHPARDSGDIVLWARAINFILKTANNWSGPIHKFHLTVLADDPGDIPLTCMRGLKRVGPTRYNLARSDFHPNEDLELIILQANRDKQNNAGIGERAPSAQ